ncbi:MAG TPA: 4-hydroxybenzoate 3-monooxygenase [Ktedonobacteraceae bacterium]|nr:4-hydroxybenzoate 3-monooxygenase [Ktedonobacteraceae bacterium]
MNMRTRVGIIGAGPAGLMLSLLLLREGIDAVVLESRSREEVESTIRAGVLEQGTADLLTEIGLGERMKREGAIHQGIELRFDGERHRIDFSDLTGGRAITLYPQHEVLKDLIAARLNQGEPILFSVKDVQVFDVSSPQPLIRFVYEHGPIELQCDFIAGCDGFHGVARSSIPVANQRVFTRSYPFGWLGILMQAPPSAEELIYTYSDRGFSLVSTRSPNLQRLYLQCDPQDDIATWSDARILEELQTRLATRDNWQLLVGPITQKSILAMRSFVIEPMQYGRLFLAGDAAHIVPPTGAKGLNLAVADVRHLARALSQFYTQHRTDFLEAYSTTCLRRVWRAEHFSWWMTSMLHRFPDDDPFQQQMQRAQLEYTVRSRAAATSLAENYVGLPFDW